MPKKAKRLEELNKKLAKLKRLRRKIEQKIKKERALAVRYAKELAYCYLEAKGEADKTGKPIEEVAFEYLKDALCSRAKYKDRCVIRKLKLIIEYADQFNKAHLLANSVLKRIEKKS